MGRSGVSAVAGVAVALSIVLTGCSGRATSETDQTSQVSGKPAVIVFSAPT